MDMQAIKDEIVLKLTGDVLDLELSDASLVKIINSSLREIQRYIKLLILLKMRNHLFKNQEIQSGSIRYRIFVNR